MGEIIQTRIASVVVVVRDGMDSTSLLIDVRLGRGSTLALARNWPWATMLLYFIFLLVFLNAHFVGISTGGIPLHCNNEPNNMHGSMVEKRNRRDELRHANWVRFCRLGQLNLHLKIGPSKARSSQSLSLSTPQQLDRR